MLLLCVAFAVDTSATELRFGKDRPLLMGIDLDYAPLEYVDENGLWNIPRN